jgi:hypothetical protein
VAGIEGVGPGAWLMAPHECGVVLLAVVGFLGGGLLVMAWRLRAAFQRLEVTRRATARHQESAETRANAEVEQTLLAEQTAGNAEIRVDDLLEIRTAIQTLIERAEAVQRSADESEAVAA